MIGSSFKPPLASQNVAPTSNASHLNGRKAKFLPPGLPRISRSTSFWTAFWRGGMTGLRQSIVRTLNDFNLNEPEEADKKNKACADIGSALKSAKNSKEWLNAFNKILQEAVWLKLDITVVVQSALSTMTVDEHHSLKKACHKIESLIWLTEEISKNFSAAKEFQQNLRIRFFESVMLYSQDKLLGSVEQKKHWEETDKLVASAGSFEFPRKVGKAISENIKDLLPFVEYKIKGVVAASKALTEFSSQAFEIIKNSEEIDLSFLSEKDLENFGVLVENKELKHHFPAYVAELEKRRIIEKVDQVKLHFARRILRLVNPVEINDENSVFFDEDDLKGLEYSQLSTIALQVVKASDPEALIALSKLYPARADDAYLINATIAQLNRPDVNAMEYTQLIAYLKLQETDISPEARKILLDEAKTRIVASTKIGFAVLEDGLNADSCDELVLAVREFLDLASISNALAVASGMEDLQEKIPQEFLKKLAALDITKLMRAKKLRICLRDNGLNKAADVLGTVLSKRPSAGWFALSERDSQSIEGAVLYYFKNSKVSQRSNKKNSVFSVMNEKILDRFLKKIYNDGNFKKIRNIDGKIIPVQSLFLKDQRMSMPSVNGTPVLWAHIPDDFNKECEFANKMQRLENITEQQIMMASFIATQSVANVVSDLAFQEKWLPFTEAEIKEFGASTTDSWFFPTGASSRQNFEMDDNGNLIAHIRIFNEKIHSWGAVIYASHSEKSITVNTDPKESSFSADLTFKVMANGKIEECIVTSWIAERKIKALMYT